MNRFPGVNTFAHGGLMTVVALLFALDASGAQVSSERRIDLLLQMLPEDARGQATIVFRDSTSEETIREGSGFICVSDVSPAGRVLSNCHHPTLKEQLELEREFTDLRGETFRRRVCAEAAKRGMRVPDGAMEITGSIGINESGQLDASRTVYHLLWLPFETRRTLGLTDEDPGDGRAWLHLAGTCQAHVMWSEEVTIDET